MIFTLPFETFRMLIPVEAGIMYFLETDELIELYLLREGNVLKSIYVKQGAEADVIWKELYLGKAFRLVSIDKGDINFRIIKEG